MATQSIVDMVLQVQTTGSKPAANRSGMSASNEMDKQRHDIAIAKMHAEQVEMSRDELENVVSQLQDYVQSIQRDMQFHIDDATGRVIVQVIDSNSQEVVRQIPSEEMLAIARHLADSIENNKAEKGFFIELKA
jgi:flagellar protein FlaG